MDRLISQFEVIRAIEKYVDNIFTKNMGDLINDIKAIPPAEPREVLYNGDGYADGEMVYDMAECMNCGRVFEYDDETWGCKFCPDCGQALKWEGWEE